jgi:hypothetical protein
MWVGYGYECVFANANAPAICDGVFLICDGVFLICDVNLILQNL